MNLSATQGDRPVPRGHPVGHRWPHLGASRVAYAFHVYMLSPLPRRSGWAHPLLCSPRRISLPRKGCRVDLRIVLFEACSAFTRVTACTLALSPIRDTLIEGFSHFVTSMTAPIASGWSGLPGGVCTHWKAPPLHGAHPRQTPGFQSINSKSNQRRRVQRSCRRLRTYAPIATILAASDGRATSKFAT